MMTSATAAVTKGGGGCLSLPPRVSLSTRRPAFSSRRSALLKNFSYQLSMDLIMEEFWDLNSTGFMYDNSLVVPYLVTFSADLEETWAASSMLKGGTYCHLKQHMSNKEFLNHEV